MTETGRKSPRTPSSSGAAGRVTKRRRGDGRRQLSNSRQSSGEPQTQQRRQNESSLQDRPNETGMDLVDNNSQPKSNLRDDVLVDTSDIRSGGDSPTTVELQKELESVKQENVQLGIALNELKNKIGQLEMERTQDRLSVKLAHEKNSGLLVELAQEKMEKEGLARLVQQLQKNMEISVRGKSKFLVRLSKSLDNKYVSLASTIDRYISSWCLAETLELIEGSDEVPRRQWNDRVQFVHEFGLKLINNPSSTASHAMLSVPYPFTSLLTSKDLFYIPSFTSCESILESIIGNVLKEPCWQLFCSTPEIRQETLETISKNAIMIGRVRQNLSDALSNRKRVVRDTLFTLLKYYNLRSTHDRRREVPLFDKAEEIKIAHQKLIPTAESGTLDYSRWRTSKITDLTSDGSFPGIFRDKHLPMDVIEVGKDSLDEEESPYNTSLMGIHKNELSFYLWKEFLGYNPILNEDDPSETTFLSITRLDAWIATVVELLQDTEQRGGGRQRDFSRSFQNHFKKATYQFITSVFEYVKYWAHDELVVGDVDDGNFKDAVTSMERETTVILYSPVDETYYIAVKSDWFQKYISPNFGIVHDCYIAKISSDWKTIIPLVSNVNSMSQNPSNADGIPEKRADDHDSNIGSVSQPLPKTNDMSHDGLDDNSSPPAYDEYEDDFAPETVPPLDKN